MKTNDAFILAYSMGEQECRGLLTFDSELINSKTLKDLIKTGIVNSVARAAI